MWAEDRCGWPQRHKFWRGYTGKFIDDKHTKYQSYTYNDNPFTLWTNIRSADLKAIRNNIIVHLSPFTLQPSDMNLKEQKLVGELRQIIGLDVNWRKMPVRREHELIAWT